MKSFLDLSGKTLLMTTSATEFDIDVARILLLNGANIILAYSEPGVGLQHLKSEFGGDRILAVNTQFDSVSDCVAIWAIATNWRGQVDALINNAARHQPLVPNGSVADWETVWIEALRVNLLSIAHLSRLAIKHYRGTGGGIIISMTCPAAVRGDRPEYFHIGAMAGAIDSFMRGLARSCAKVNVQTYLVCTDVRDHQNGRSMADIPLGRLPKPQDLANIFLFLSSGKARYASGSTIDAVGASFLH